MSSSSARPAPTRKGPSPLFGIEIEIFVKVKDRVQAKVLHKLASRGERASVPEHWQKWDFDLSNNSKVLAKKEAQRLVVGQAIEAAIKKALGDKHGWTCEPDASLKERDLDDRKPKDGRKYWGIEIISPPMSSKKHWQVDIKRIFEAVEKQFDLWTNECCACHVHVSPGPKQKDKYTLADLVKVANGAFLWEQALQGLLPPARRTNRYAEPNHTVFATAEYKAVQTKGWEPVFRKIFAAAKNGEMSLVGAMTQTSLDATTGELQANRYLSTSFHPYFRLGTIELRRQAGVASATAAIHRVLLALTLHVSALDYSYNNALKRKDHPTTGELVTELSRCNKLLPATCHGADFGRWLRKCADDYSGSPVVLRLRGGTSSGGGGGGGGQPSRDSRR
ncbi:hypothetical protein BT67DRAFT_59864 [Trichocladium antarcticum]|uniref:Amidoligase enzyme n=1 Tax=Trichocladium antarcticum TaxID=1450529 RepID=A0AAN6ZCU6_9PEZI|nr:hypothetical protein BT67DRAFT_59864 [Trichocladium antarcticum]